MIRILLVTALFGYATFLYNAISAANFQTQNAALKLAGSLPHGDKIGHFLLMGSLALLVNLAMDVRRINIRGRYFLLGSLTVCLIVTLEELSQIAIPARTFSFYDLAADYLGIYLFGRLAVFLANAQIPRWTMARFNLWRKRRMVRTTSR